jgi:Protein of unknown function (DUF2974).
MANFYHYLEWRGDISFDMCPLNEVDALIFTWLVYADLQGVVPDTLDATGISVAAASRAFFETHEHHGHLNLLDSLNPPLTATVLLDRLSTCPRFQDIHMTYLVDRIDYDNPTQFAAMTFFLPDDKLFVAYRGTDRSFVGWKEDCYISCRDEIPSQVDALAYLEAIAAAFPNKKLILGGHSKGGNLAAYAAIMASPEVRGRIEICYNHDGPGFSKAVTQSDGYREMKAKISKFVPQSSIVGLLFDRERDFEVIKSNQVGFLQHNGPCWEVLGSRLVRGAGIVKSTLIFDESLSTWLDELDNEQRLKFIDALFSVFEKSNLKTFDDIGSNKIKALLGIVHAAREMDSQTSGMLVKALFGLFKARSAMNAQTEITE